MKVSLNVIKQYVDFELPSTDELVRRINEQLGGVEEVTDLHEKYKDARIVKVVECDKHPDADRLSVCKIDAGTGELVQVVCGAPNVHADMYAVWLPPESIVPSTYGTDDEFELGARELRGVMSHGMLAAGDELAINNDHDGIIEIDPNEWKPNDVEIKPGVSFAEVYGLDDTIIDIENKMFTHRPDCFGQLGVAREIAGIFGRKFSSPSWYLDEPNFDDVIGVELEVFNDASEKVPRFMAVVLKDVTVKSSPLWLQIELMRLGSKAINNIVDVTNYVMLLTAQPTHAYDYEKLRGAKLGARMAVKGETATLLNGKTYEFAEDDIVIADGEGVVGLAGIMGGGESEVSRETKNVVLEVATFDMYAIRKSSMWHGIFTDALTRFNKGQSPFQNNRVMNLLMMSIKDVAGGAQASKVYDLRNTGEVRQVSVTPDFINERLGLKLTHEEVKTLLTNVELGVDEELHVTPAFWRTDIELPEDIVEEVGRLYGFDKLPRELPKRSMKPAAKNDTRELANVARKALAGAGANEVLTYSFVHKNVIEKARQNPDEAYRLGNALSPDLQYFRLSLTPSLLDKVHMNSKAGYDDFALFEIGKAHSKKALGEDGPPAEIRRIALTYAAKKAGEGAPYYKAKALLDRVAQQLGLKLAYKSLPEDTTLTALCPFDVKRSARAVDEKSGQVIGVIGEYAADVKRAFKLPEHSAGFELMAEGIELALKAKENSYRSLSRFPSVSQDMSLRVDADISYSQLFEVVEAALSVGEADGIHGELSPVVVYQPEAAKEKTITLRYIATADNRTLKDDEVSRLVKSAAHAASAHLGAVLV